MDNTNPIVTVTLTYSQAHALLAVLDDIRMTGKVFDADRPALQNVAAAVEAGIKPAQDALCLRSEQQAFEDAAAHMSQDDWDHDNAWLESAGWGEM